MTQGSHEITRLLLAWSEGDREALDRLAPLVYAELRRLAKSYMRKERAGHTLQTTALIHEAYLRLIDAGQVEWRNRAHFFGVAACAMRQVSLDEAMVIDAGPDEDLVALDEALEALAQFDARKAQVVEMRFFGGLTEAEIAASLDVSSETVRRDWRLARSWLRRKLSVEQGGET